MGSNFVTDFKSVVSDAFPCIIWERENPLRFTADPKEVRVSARAGLNPNVITVKGVRKIVMKMTAVGPIQRAREVLYVLQEVTDDLVTKQAKVNCDWEVSEVEWAGIEDRTSPVEHIYVEAEVTLRAAKPLATKVKELLEPISKESGSDAELAKALLAALKNHQGQEVLSGLFDDFFGGTK